MRRARLLCGGLAFWLALALLLGGAWAEGESPAASFSLAGCDLSQTRRDWSSHRFFPRMAERTGVSFGTFRQFDSAEAFGAWKRGLQPDSGDLPDVLFKALLSDEETRTLYERGVLIDLAPYITAETMPNLTALFAEHPEWRAACTLPDGAVVTLPSIDPIQTNNLMWINTDWLRAVGREAPTTAEELTETLRAFRDQDANHNGNRGDEIPMTFTGMWDLRWLLHAYGVVMNDYGVAAGGDGAIFSPLYTAEMREGLAWLHTLWEERLLDSAGFTAGESLRRITDDKNIPYGMLFGPTVTNLLPDSQMAKYRALMPLTHGGRQVYRSLLGEVTRGTFAVTCRCADPAAVLRWADALYTEEGCFLAHAGLEGEEYTVSVDAEGRRTWRWTFTANEVQSKVYAVSAIADDLPVPGLIPPEYQADYDDAALQTLVAQNLAVAAVAREACPQVFFTAEEAARLAEIWKTLGLTVERRLTWFVTGDDPLNDETWAAFIGSLDEEGMPEVVQIWQAAADRWRTAMNREEEAP